jgi:DHA3 family tetracycline resistance protein-like MFS transporter
MSSQVDALGQNGGGPVVGLVAKQISIRAGLLASAAILSPVLALLARQLRPSREEIPPQSQD